MAKRKIIWSANAQRHRLRILEFWTRHNGSAAFSRKLDQKFRERLQLLKEQPFLGKCCPAGDAVYTTAVEEFLLFYQISEDIIVLAVWDRRRDPATAPFPTELNEP